MKIREKMNRLTFRIGVYLEDDNRRDSRRYADYNGGRRNGGNTDLSARLVGAA